MDDGEAGLEWVTTMTSASRRSHDELPAGGGVMPWAAAAASAIRLRFVDGSEHLLGSDALLGRRPEALAQTLAIEAIALVDPQRTVSRAHALLLFREGKIGVVDQGSGNGTRCQRGGVMHSCTPHEPTPVLVGDTLWFGEFSCEVMAA